jgi:hypothetical protein
VSSGISGLDLRQPDERLAVLVGRAQVEATVGRQPPESVAAVPKTVTRRAWTRCMETGAMADEVEPEAHALPLGADLWVGQPDRRHEVPAGELGENPGVDQVGGR